MNNKTIELLSPAGNMQSVVAATKSGADAIYFGAKSFSARARANNFEQNEIETLTTYCHERNVKAYLAINTLIKQRELNEAINIVINAYNVGVDAFIVADIGFAQLIKKHLPKAILHASTQLGVSNAQGAIFAQKIGFSRVVLARELSFCEIKTIVAQLKDYAQQTQTRIIETEVFVQGAMCVSVSGQCLFSSVVGQRSGNRGRCAQACRLEYSLFESDEKTKKQVEEKSYLLSMKDLCRLEDVKFLAQIGVTSLKIEGRMKRFDYVHHVTKAYREEIENAQLKTKENIEKMSQIFARGAFTRGYEKGEKLVFSKTPDSSKPVPKQLYDEAVDSQTQTQKQKISFEFYAKIGEPCCISVSLLNENNLASEIFFAKVSGDVVQKAQNAPTTKEKVSISLNKLGETNFFCEKITFNIQDEDIFLPISSINKLRNSAVFALIEKQSFQREQKNNLKKDIVTNQERLNQQPLILENQYTEKNVRKKTKPLIIAQVQSMNGVNAAIFAQADEIYFAPRNFEKQNENTIVQAAIFAKKSKIPIYLVLPPVIFPSQEAIIESVLQKAVGFFGLVVGNISGVFQKQNFEKIITDYTLNIFNSLSAQYIAKQENVHRVTLSTELNASQLAQIAQSVEGSEIIVYGKLPLMNLRYCPINRAVSCANCQNKTYTLKDRKDYEFELLPYTFEKSNCLIQLLNEKTLDAIGAKESLTKINASAWRLIFNEENQIAQKIEQYRSARENVFITTTKNATAGAYKQNVH